VPSSFPPRSGSLKFYDYRESRQFAQKLKSWIDQVAREVAPKDPAAALALFESFITADSSWFERADDSDGRISDAVREACGHWLKAASLCETPSNGWPARLAKLARAGPLRRSGRAGEACRSTAREDRPR